MSKLYDVISRLEEVAAKDGDNPESPIEVEAIPFETKRSPMTRILLLAMLFVILGLGSIAALFWWKDSFIKKPASSVASVPVQPPAPKPESVSAAVDPAPIEPVATVNTQVPGLPETPTTDGVAIPQELQNRVEPAPRIMSVNVAGLGQTEDEIEKILREEAYISPFDTPAEPDSTASVNIRNLATITFNKKEEQPREDSPATIEPQVPTEDVAETFTKSSRWLHQAELYRHQGEWESAITLYRRVFDITKDPAVANNLAAALIERKRPEEALKVIHEGIMAAPDDHDLQQNLKVVKQMLDAN